MKKSLLCLFICITASAFGQDLFFYHSKEKREFYDENLKDTLQLEVHLPKDYILAENSSFPLIILMDSQNEINHRYNLNTIDYLTGLGAMPGCIVVSIGLENQWRALWTIPEAEGGLGDKLLDFITSELHDHLTNQYRMSDAHFIVGHSRTAIFGMYALSKRSDYFTGCIASSAAYFDGGSQIQKKVFDNFIKENKKSKVKKYFYFSAGTSFYGDGHEPFCDELNAYLSNVMEGTNIEWAYFKEDADHFTIPGLTVNRALNNIFRGYRSALQACFEELKNPENAKYVIWDKFNSIYSKASQTSGFEILPDLTFYFSLASTYSNDYEEFFKENSIDFTLQMLLQGEKKYPRVCEVLDWIKEIYTEQDNPAARDYEEKMKTCIAVDE
jgi:hypothetical protein